jgi:hypothetical protein
VITHRLQELRFEQRDLAAAAQVTESYISLLWFGSMIGRHEFETRVVLWRRLLVDLRCESRVP